MQVDGANGGEARRASPTMARLLFAPARFGGIASVLLMLGILGLITWAVAERYFFNRPLPWSDDLAGMLLVAMVGFGMAEALRRGDHIAIDLLSARVGRAGARLRDAWAALAVLVFACVLAWSTSGQIKFAYDFDSYTPGEIEVQTWIPMLPLLVGWVILALTALGQLLEALFGPEPS
jgi:TRAP-type C4-dicarboxylate transport system permease small subunit